MKLIEGVKIKNLKYHCDVRGLLTEILRKDEELLNGLGGRSRNGFM
ncbi:hypothetical protein [Alkaliphilus hydrothermalis]|uniref:dTDP-4-dehydrorhamnose 3,5-epimerase-like enzyme n=1 Tax=Alkaliphilus hydrothermalis TaxID=1482730 RepID=A0ABS2NLW3_9FIRM|nr:hypothetical protein [Alkaliphilus hydrothermalis]MBM7613935.1 dTDP-4-dehydrorhamnose 3,5-epimerase-like enzyme [Alkaliphilus hydrothermalis]